MSFLSRKLKSQRSLHVLQYALALGLLTYFLLLPAGHIMLRAFYNEGSFRFDSFTNLLQNPVLLLCIRNSLLVGISVTLLSTFLALPYALALGRFNLPGKKALMGSMMLPMLLPPFVGAIAFKQLFARFGTVNIFLQNLGVIDSPIDWLGSGFWGLVILESIHLFPILYFNIVGAISQMDGSAEEAALHFGGRNLRYFTKVALPQLRPALASGMALTFVWAFTDLGTPLLLEFRQVIPYQVFTMVTDIHSNDMGYALTVILCVFGLGGFWLSQFWSRGYRKSLVKGAKPPASFSLGKLGDGLLASGLWFGLFLSSLPLLCLILFSFSDHWFMTALPESYTWEFFKKVGEHRLSRGSLQVSLFLSGLACLLDLVAGWWLARLIAQCKGFARIFLEAIVMLPLALPGIILAFGYVSLFSGSWLDPARNPVPLLIAGYAVRRIPFMVRSVLAGYSQIPETYDEAARCLGDGFWGRLWRVHLPLLSSSLLGAGILIFAFSMLEVSDSLILAMEEFYYPVTKAIFFLTTRAGDGSHMAAALGIVGTLILAAALWLSGRLLGNRMGEMFKAG